MRCFDACVLVPLLLLAAGGQKRKPTKPPSLEVLEITVHRTTERTVEIDGRIRNSGDKQLQKITIRFRVLAPDNATLTTQRGDLEPEILDPGEEAEFHWQMREPARAVAVLVEAVDLRDAELVIAKAGPYAID
jgi:hypothetical protein